MASVPPQRYSAFGQLIHWVTALLVLMAFIYGPGGSEERVYAPARDFQRSLHETLGLSVLALVVLRLVWRLVARTPHPPAVPRWMSVTANAVRGLLYLLMLAVPLTAIAGAWLEGHPLTLLGGLHVGPWLAESHDLGGSISELHTWLGD